MKRKKEFKNLKYFLQLHRSLACRFFLPFHFVEFCISFAWLLILFICALYHFLTFSFHLSPLCSLFSHIHKSMHKKNFFFLILLSWFGFVARTEKNTKKCSHYMLDRYILFILFFCGLLGT